MLYRYMAAMDALSLREDCTEKYEHAFMLLCESANLDRVVETEYARFFRDSANAYAARLALEYRFDEADEVNSIVERMLELDYRVDFDAFMLLLEYDRDPKARFWMPRRRHLTRACEAFQDVYDDVIDLFCLGMPTRTGKSTLGCFFVLFVMATRPLSSSIMSGYANKLTSSFYEEIKTLLTDSEYRYARMFPDAPLVGTNADDTSLNLLKSRRFCSLTCRSLEGSIEGAMEVCGGGVLYCDDMVRGYEQALSVERMEKLYDIYSTQLKGRKKERAKEIHIGTRWAPNDLIGEIEATDGNTRRCRFLYIPALDGNAYDEWVPAGSPAVFHATVLDDDEENGRVLIRHEDGKSNFDYPFGLGFSTEHYEAYRDDLIEHGNEHIWRAKCQQDPIHREGRLFEENELRYFSELPEGEPDVRLAVCDTKGKGDDFCSQPVAYVYGNDFYIVDVVFDDGKMLHIEPRLVNGLCENKVDKARYESNLAGDKIASEVEYKCRARGHSITITTKYSTTNKETRIIADEPWVKQRCLFLDAKHRSREYASFMRNLTSYSSKGKNKHDDAPDSMSMLRRFAESTIKSKATPMRRPL